MQMHENDGCTRSSIEQPHEALASTHRLLSSGHRNNPDDRSSATRRSLARCHTAWLEYFGARDHEHPVALDGYNLGQAREVAERGQHRAVRREPEARQSLALARPSIERDARVDVAGQDVAFRGAAGMVGE